jgi:hypothetical protein
VDRTIDMTKDGFTFLVMGFTGRKAASFKEAYIARFNEMEAEIRAAAISRHHQHNLSHPAWSRATSISRTDGGAVDGHSGPIGYIPTGKHQSPASDAPGSATIPVLQFINPVTRWALIES